MGTGAYLRIERNGKWQNLEVEYLTPDEMMAMFIGRSNEELIRWMNVLASRIMYYETTLLYLEEALIGNRLDSLCRKITTWIWGDLDPDNESWEGLMFDQAVTEIRKVVEEEIKRNL